MKKNYLFYLLILVIIGIYYFSKLSVNNLETFLSSEKSKELYYKHINDMKNNITYLDFLKDIQYFNDTTEIIKNNREITL